MPTDELEFERRVGVYQRSSEKTELQKEGEMSTNTLKHHNQCMFSEEFIVLCRWNICEGWGQKCIGERVENHFSRSFIPVLCVLFTFHLPYHNYFAKIQIQQCCSSMCRHQGFFFDPSVRSECLSMAHEPCSPDLWNGYILNIFIWLFELL